MGDSKAAADLVNELESGSFFSAGSGKTLTTEYTGTVIIDEVTDEVVAAIEDPREVYSALAEGVLRDWKAEGAAETYDLSGEKGMAVMVESAFSTVSEAALTTELTAFVAVEILSCNVAVALHPLIKAEDEGYFRGETDPLTSATSACPDICFKGEERDDAIVALAVEMTSAADLVGDTTDFKGEEISGVADVIMDLNGKLEEYIVMFDLGEAGGVMVMEDLSNRDPAVVTGEVREEKVELGASPFMGVASVMVGTLPRVPEATWGLYGDGDTTVFIGEETVRKDLIGDATSLMDLTEDVVEAPNVDLIGEGVETDHMDFNGEADGVLEGELDKEPDLAGPGTVIGAVVQDWYGLVEKNGLCE